MNNKERLSNNEESLTKNLALRGKKAFFAMTAAMAIGSTVTGCDKAPVKIESKEAYEAVLNDYLAFKPDLSVVFSEEDGTTINWTEYGNTRFTLKDEDNDTLIESGSIVYDGKVAKFSDNDGVPINGAENILRHKLNTGQ